MKKFDGDYTGNPMRTHVYKQLERAILDETLAPGTSLGEIKLATDLGVSRTPVREALMQLELEGLVKTVPNKGAVVVGVSAQDIDDIYTIRTRIEGLVARRTAEKITPEELQTMREIVELQEFYVERGDTTQVWNLDNRFHDLLYEWCHSRPLKQMMSLFHSYIQNARYSSIKAAGRAANSTREHRLILDAIAAKDPELAERMTEQHAKNARDSFFEIL